MSTDPYLGDGYESHRIDLGADAEGPMIATLIHRRAPGAPTGRKPPILLMHGWSDYVLDRELMEHLGRNGHDVWGLDLRKHGRSLLPGQTATEVDHLNRYDAEIGASLRIIGRDRPPVLLAHSTGGLTAALWAQRNPGTVRGLALNSPWLEMHLGPVTRTLAQVPVRLLAERLRGRPIFPLGSDHYARTLHRDFGGAYDYDLALKPPGGHPFPAVTLSAIIDGQRRLAAAGPLPVPVLVLHSAHSRLGAGPTRCSTCARSPRPPPVWGRGCGSRRSPARDTTSSSPTPTPAAERLRSWTTGWRRPSRQRLR